MKKILALILAILMVFSLVACANKTENTNETENDNQTNYVPSVEKVSEGKPFFVSITNAKGEITVTANNDANHKNVQDIISGNKITNKKDKLFLNHIAYVTVEDRWTATYNCDNIGSDASITFSPKDKTANIMNITCKFSETDVSYGGANYESVTFAQDGTVTVKKVTGKLSFSSKIDSQDGFGDIDIRGNINKEGDVTIKKIADNKYEITSTSDISSLNANYMLNKMDKNDGESTMLNEMSDKVAKKFTITISADKITIE